MLTQVRPDIANATEQTVLNLKELEGRIDALKADVAWLCQGLGHPEAARIAAAPTPVQLANAAAIGAIPAASIPAFGGFPAHPSTGWPSPPSLTPWSGTAPGAPFASPIGPLHSASPAAFAQAMAAQQVAAAQAIAQQVAAAQAIAQQSAAWSAQVPYAAAATPFAGAAPAFVAPGFVAPGSYANPYATAYGRAPSPYAASYTTAYGSYATPQAAPYAPYAAAYAPFASQAFGAR